MLDRIREKREEIYAIARRNHAEKVWLFGSCARREERPESDVDFLVKWTPGNYSWHNERAMLEAYERMFGRKVELVSNKMLFDPENTRFASVVCKEAVAV